MPSNIDALFGVHAQALKTHATRNRVLASNIANADTPHYKARDVDFRQAMSAAESEAPGLRRTHARHLDASGAGAGRNVNPTLLYRMPAQPSLDGNTVEADVEKAAFAENAIRYQASLMFIGGKVRGFNEAIQGAR